MHSLIFKFADVVSMKEVEDTLTLALVAAQSLHGELRVTLEAGYTFDPSQRLVAIDRSTAVGTALATLFGGYAIREFGTAGVTIRRPIPEGGGA